jgi:hypothetical protein
MKSPQQGYAVVGAMPPISKGVEREKGKNKPQRLGKPKAVEQPKTVRKAQLAHRHGGAREEQDNNDRVDRGKRKIAGRVAHSGRLRKERRNRFPAPEQQETGQRSQRLPVLQDQMQHGAPPVVFPDLEAPWNVASPRTPKRSARAKPKPEAEFGWSWRETRSVQEKAAP